MYFYFLVVLFFSHKFACTGVSEFWILLIKCSTFSIIQSFMRVSDALHDFILHLKSIQIIGFVLKI